MNSDAERIGDILREAELTIGIVECSLGGTLTRQLVGIPGASAWLEFGIFPYSAHTKRRFGGYAYHDGFVSKQFVRNFGETFDGPPSDFLFIESCIAKELHPGARSRKRVGDGWYVLLLHGIIFDEGQLSVPSGMTYPEDTMDRLAVEALRKLRETLEQWNTTSS